MLVAMLTLDLRKAKTRRREQIYAGLEAEGWEKVAGVTTAWVRQEFDTYMSEDLQYETADLVQDLAAGAGVRDYGLAVHVGMSDPYTLSVP